MGLYSFTCHLVVVVLGSPGGTISKIGAFYPGYSFTWVGGLIGFFWGFVEGFICGVIIAWLYNIFHKDKPAAA